MPSSATLAALVPAWRGDRAGTITVVVARLLSAATALPAFVADDVPAPASAAAAIGIVLTLAALTPWQPTSAARPRSRPD